MPMRLRTCSSALAAILFAVVLVGLPTPAEAQSAKVRYERALAREQAARRQAAPSLTTLRSIATAYEQIVRRYPRSGYSDNALWQAAGVLQLAWEREGQARDRDKAVSLLEWLRREYPSSSLVRRVDGRLAELKRPRGGEAVARATAPSERRPAASAPAAAGTGRSAASPASPAARPAAAPAKPAEPVAVRGLSHTVLPRGERLTFELSRETTFATAPGAEGRVTLTLANAEAARAIVEAARRIRGRVIEAVDLENAGDGLRVEVRVKGQPRQSGFTLYGPDRVAFDFESPSDAAEPAETADTATRRRDAVPAPPPFPLPSTSASGAESDAKRELPADVPATPALADSPSSTDAEARPAAPAPDPGDADVESGEAEATLASTGAADTDEVSDEALAPPAPPSTIRGGYSLARQLGLGVSRIVIDPGHGGPDPGAQANGVTEAEVVLDIALRLEKLLLEQPGFEVVLTRRKNVAVPLERRTAIANEERADLFLSIHANSSPRRETAGVETYFLNLATNPQAEAVAARENAASSHSMHTLPQLVRAITNNNKIAESRELAGTVQASLVRRLKARNSSFQDLGVKQAPFVVLIGAQMPSVLAEVAFLTNRAEAALLKQPAYRQQVAQALCDAILEYRASLKKVATVTASAEGR